MFGTIRFVSTSVRSDASGVSSLKSVCFWFGSGCAIVSSSSSSSSSSSCSPLLAHDHGEEQARLHDDVTAHPPPLGSFPVSFLLLLLVVRAIPELKHRATCPPRIEGRLINERQCATFFFSEFLQARLTQAHTTHKVDFLVLFLSTFRPRCGFTLLLCAMIASFAVISDRVILAELEGTLVLSFSDSLWVSGFLSHLLSVRRFGCDGGSDSFFLVSSSLFPLLFLCLFFCLAFSHHTS